MAEFRHVYHLQGVSDAKRQKEVAARAGGAFILHEHAKGQPCNDQCKAYWPEEAAK